MKRNVLTGVLLVTMLLVGVPAAAQDGADPPPTIISFSGDLDGISMADAESGDTEVELSWQTVGVSEGYSVNLFSYRFNRWELYQPESEDEPETATETITALPTSGSLRVPVLHPQTFGPPTFRLAIVDAQGFMVTEWTLALPYVVEDDADEPEITLFRADVTSLDANALADGSARVTASWQITDRQPGTNLLFEQVLPGGQVAPVELSRALLWVPSSGAGPLAPVFPGEGEAGELRLRLVDLADGSTLDEEQVTLTVTGQVQAVPSVPETSPTTPVTAPSSSVQVQRFDATPGRINRGSSVTINWQVTGASTLGVWLLSPDGRLSQSAPNAAMTGSWTLTLPDVYGDTAIFMLFAQDYAGTEIQTSLMVDIECDYAYFFEIAEELSCPEADAQTVQAAFQDFERGYMVWRADTGEIFVLYDYGDEGFGQVNYFRDTWAGEELPPVDETPPEYLDQPVRGFGKVWLENEYVREGLGWAVGAEMPYTMTYQASSDLTYRRWYMTFPSGRIFYVVSDEWRLVR
ncbi:MAG: hypothetical protein GYB65_04235 [Chloroflexi bacterium]|nr:hypothetical protein [Chloroflexota bacterium]